MTLRLLALPFAIAAVACTGASPTPSPAPAPLSDLTPIEDDTLVRIARRWNAVGEKRGIGVAVIDGSAIRFHGAGRRGDEGTGTPDADTIFPIGSISKVLVGYLLADAAVRGEVSLEDPVNEYLPKGFSAPSFEGTSIELVHLATLSSGLPFFPDNWVGTTKEKQVAYTNELFAQFLAGYRLEQAPGTKFIYGNTGTGLLALALSTRAHEGFGELLRDRIFTPMGLFRSSYPDGSGPPDDDVFVGHDEADADMPWRTEVSPLGACCAVRSTLRDLAAFARAILHPGPREATAMRALVLPRVATKPDGSEHYGLGVRVKAADGVVWKDGQVSGQRTVLALVPAEDRGVVVTVSSYQVDITGLAFDILNALGASRTVAAAQ
jgi:CubicO group peptidase (beta-lactamase class C family)